MLPAVAYPLRMSNHPCCPLCASNAQPFLRDRQRQYFQCHLCRLVFVRAEDCPSPAEEKAVYELHENSPNDAGYRLFLSRLCNPMMERLVPGSRGLDFGCGPGPTLSVMFEEQGCPMSTYDPCFFPNRTVLDGKFSFVTATEVVEHFQRPSHSWDQMWACIEPGGLLGIMTKLVIDRDAFSRWHYKDDETHLCFYSRETLAWIAKRWGAALEVLGKDVFIFRRV